MTAHERSIEFEKWYNFSDDGREVVDVAEAMIAAAEFDAVQAERKRIAAKIAHDIQHTYNTPLEALIDQVKKGCEP